MLRKELPRFEVRRGDAVVALLSIALGLGALGWGGARLQAIFVEERDTAREAVGARRRAIEGLARVSLERKLRAALAGARPRIDAALDNPLLSEPGLLAIDDGEQRLPRSMQFREGTDAPARALFSELEKGTAAAEDGIWGERVALLGALEQALGRGDDEAITHAVRDLLNHQSRYVTAVAKDLPLTLCFLKALVRESTPDRSLMQALLRDGLRGTRGRKLIGLQPLLLAHRHELTRADFSFLAGEIVSLSRAARVPHDDFAAQLFSENETLISVPEELDAAALIAGGAWYVAPLERGSLRGVAADLDGLLEETASEMRSAGFLGPSDSIAPRRPIGPLATVADLPLVTRSESFDAELGLIDRRYALKTAIGLALGALVIVVAVLGTLLNLRQRRFLESKASFVATVSHELRTPIASLRVMGETLERRLEGIESAKDFPSRIVHEVDRLNFLIENILSFNRLERRVSTNREPIAVGELLEACRPDVAAFTKKPVALVVSEGGGVTLKVDTTLAQLLFSNLIHNACKYNARASVEITIRAADEAKASTVRFSDNGIGIPPEEWETVFTEFARAKNSAGSGGFGLGLALCRRILRLHGGTIRVIESSDAGTTFELIFPKENTTA